MDKAREIFDAIIQSLNDPQRVHAMVAHFPVAVAVFGLLGVLALTVTGGKWRNLRWLLVLLYAAGAFIAWGVTESGEWAEHSFDTSKLTAEAAEALEWHEWLGEYLWIGMVATPVLLSLTAIKKTGLRIIFVLLSLTASLGTFGWVAATAHFGGEMVYVRGVGVPQSPNSITEIRHIEPEAPPPTDGGDTPVKTDQPAEAPPGVKKYDPRFPPEIPDKNIFDFDDKPKSAPDTPAPNNGDNN